jgi:hypothetical protein
MNKRYTPEQDKFIRENYSSAKKCTELFNKRFGTNLSYYAIRGHAQNILKLRTNFRIWTADMIETIADLLKEHTFKESTALLNAQYGTNQTVEQVQTHCKKAGIGRGTHNYWTDEKNIVLQNILTKMPYREATREFNTLYGTNFTEKQIQSHCTKTGMKRGFYEQRKEIDKIIASNIEKPYAEIAAIIADKTSVQYKNVSTVCVRANNIGLHRAHRVWSTADKRHINGKHVSFSEYVRFIGNRFHRLPKEFHATALLVVKLQATASDLMKGV